MSMVLFFKSWVPGYFRDGKWVKGYQGKKSKAAEPAPKGKPVKLPLPKKDYGHWGQPSLFGAGFHSPPPKPDAPKKVPKMFHPEVDDNGKKVPIWNPSKPSAPEAWGQPDEVATLVPGGHLPAALNGVAFAPWTDHPKTLDGWDYVEGQNEDLDEPPMQLSGGREPAAGVIIEEPDGRVWIIHPTNGFAGYKATFPKGHAEPELSLQAAAIKECFEESGLKVEIEGFVCDVNRTQTVTRYYRAKRVGGTPSAMGWETQAVSLVPKEDVEDFVNHHYDKKVAASAGFSPGAPLDVEQMDDWTQVGKQKGSNPGGFFEDHDGDRWYCKFPKTLNHAKNELLTAKLYEALGIRVPDLKLVDDGGRIGIASRVVEGVKQNAELVKSGKVPGTYEGFVADAWLANWDAVGMGHDNLLVMPDGSAIRIDVGGSLLYRAQGEPKGEAFGNKVGEIETLRSPKNHWPHSVFGKMPESEIAAGVKRLSKLPDAEIRDAVETYGPGGKKARAALADKLIARKNDLLARYPVE